MFPRICFSNTVKEKVATPIFPKDLQAIMQSPFVQEICDKIVLLDGKDPEEMARLKQQLPVVYFHAQRFEDNLRKSANAVPSGLVMLDIDHVDNPQDFAKSLLEKEGNALFLEQNRIALVAKTPSNHGIRIVGEMHEGETIVQAQQRIADLFDVKQYDAVTKDLARASFVMPWSYVYYFDEDILCFHYQSTADQWGNTTALKEVPSEVLSRQVGSRTIESVAVTNPSGNARRINQIHNPTDPTIHIVFSKSVHTSDFTPPRNVHRYAIPTANSAFAQ